VTLVDLNSPTYCGRMSSCATGIRELIASLLTL